MGLWSRGMMLALGARGREFDSLKSPSPPVGDGGDDGNGVADMAQVVARCSDKAEVFGSIPNIRTVFNYFVLVVQW